MKTAVPVVFDAVFTPIGQVLGYLGPAVAVLALQADDGIVLVLRPAALLVYFGWAGIETLPALLSCSTMKMCCYLCPILSFGAAGHIYQYAILLRCPWFSFLFLLRQVILEHQLRDDSLSIALETHSYVLDIYVSKSTVKALFIQSAKMIRFCAKVLKH